MTRTTALLLTAVILLSGVPMSAAAETTQDVTLTISVVDRNGNPVADATVEATWDGGSATETTRSNGKTLIDAPAGAEVDVEVTSQEYIRNTNYEIDSASGEEVEITVAQKGSATVEITDTEGNTVADAGIRLWHDGTRVVDAKTNGNGVHETKDIEQGEYRLYVSKEGYRKNSTTLQVDGDVSVSLAIEEGYEPVTFRVMDDHFDPPTPVKNATISVAGGNFPTLGNGENTLKVGVNDEYDVTVQKPGYQTVTETVDVGEEPTSLNVSIRRTPAISIDSLADRIVVGENNTITITDEYGTPVENASVTLDGDSIGLTNADGELTFAIDSEGEHRIEAVADGLTSTATIEAGELATERPATTTTAANGTDGTEESSGGGPGFTPLAALVGALLAILVLARR